MNQQLCTIAVLRKRVTEWNSLVINFCMGTFSFTVTMSVLIISGPFMLLPVRKLVLSEDLVDPHEHTALSDFRLQSEW